MSQFVFACLAAAAFAASLGYFLYSYLVVFGAGTASAAPVDPAIRSSPMAAWLVNLALFGLFAVHHSVFARTRTKAFVTRLLPRPVERAFYTLVASILFSLVCWLWQPVPGNAWTLHAPWRTLGFAVQLAGVVLTVIGARALDVWELAGVRQVISSPERVRHVALKTDGLYGFVRHPVYFAWVLLVFGAPDMTMTRLSFAVISTAYLALAIPFEERTLVETFGPAYASYRTKVRWRLLPGIW